LIVDIVILLPPLRYVGALSIAALQFFNLKHFLQPPPLTLFAGTLPQQTRAPFPVPILRQ
jgi:hypothetical protein